MTGRRTQSQGGMQNSMSRSHDLRDQLSRQNSRNHEELSHCEEPELIQASKECAPLPPQVNIAKIVAQVVDEVERRCQEHHERQSRHEDARLPPLA